MFTSGDQRMIDIESRLRIIDGILNDAGHAGAWEKRISALHEEIESIGEEISDYLEGLCEQDDDE